MMRSDEQSQFILHKLREELREGRKKLDGIEKELKKRRAKNMELEEEIKRLETEMGVYNISSKIIVDPECRHFDRLVLSGSTITAKNWANVFGKNRLVGQCQFTATFSKISDVVALGVMDTQNKTKGLGDWKFNQAFYYNDGKCYVDGKNQGQFGVGFKQGEPVTFLVDLTTGSIQWKVGTSVRHQVNYEKLKDNSIAWVPFIYLKLNDSVMISG